MLNEAPNLNLFWSSLLIEELVRNGVRTFCIAPGSRSAPLALAAAANSQVQTVVHFDERGAAFHALGHAKGAGHPAVFVCSSGTAVANALPAVVEAAMAQVPLILLTADRPPELLDAGANQTIDHTNLFGQYLRWFHGLPCPTEDVGPELVLTTVDQAVYRARRAPAGPVHLNCPFREPLDPHPEEYNRTDARAPIATWLESGRPYTRYGNPPVAARPEPVGEVANVLAGVTRGVLAVGQLSSPQEQDSVVALSRLLGWPTLPDVTSGLRFADPGLSWIHHYDPMLLSEDSALHRAGAVLQVGGAITSKRLLAFLADGNGRPYFRLANHPFRWDPAHRVTHRIEGSLYSFAVALAELGPWPHAVDAPWTAALRTQSDSVEAALGDTADPAAGVTEVSAARLVSQQAPEGSVLFLGNSMPIRDADLFGVTTGHRVRVAANRGASGIDGNIATATGYANATGQPTTAVLGDLAALHDLSSFTLLRESKVPVAVIIINNDGGGIFSLLPIGGYPEYFTQYFSTPHGLRFAGFAESFGIAYTHPESNEAFIEAYRAALASPGPTLIEVNTRREENAALHKALQEKIAALPRG